MRKYVEQDARLPNWSAPISHAVVVNNLCYLSGQLSLDAEGAYVPGSTIEEARRAFANLFNAVTAAGFTPQDLVFVDVAFIDINEVSAINALYAELFPAGRRPARTVYQAAALPYGARIKVMGVAVRDDAAGA